MVAVPPDYMKTVVFLCSEEKTERGIKRIPKATGFCVVALVENSPNHCVYYVATARHCVQAGRENGKIYIRMNRKSGDFVEFPTDADDWYCHDNADVALIPFLPQMLPGNVDPKDLDITVLDPEDFVGGAPEYKATTEYKGHKMEIRLQPGYEVYLLGLFTEHYGDERNLPIARFGNISRMPDYLSIESQGTMNKIVAYLIEFHSWGGHSGSPVFFLYPTIVQQEFPLPFKRQDGSLKHVLDDVRLIWTTGFMGLVSGHYPKVEDAKITGDVLGKIQYELNTGIAFVTPAVAVTELLMRDDLVEHRKALKKIANSQRPMPKLDSAASKDTFTQADLEDTSNKVSRRIKPDKPCGESS